MDMENHHLSIEGGLVSSHLISDIDLVKESSIEGSEMTSQPGESLAWTHNRERTRSLLSIIRESVEHCTTVQTVHLHKR